jgi:hypothetical protein
MMLFGKTSNTQVTLNAGVTGTIVSVSGAGMLNSLTIQNSSGSGSAQLEVVVDGVSYKTTTISAGSAIGVLTGAGTFASNTSSASSGQCNIAFKTSILVRYNTNTFSSASVCNASYTTL